MVNVNDYPTLAQDQAASRRDAQGNWLVDPELHPTGGEAYKRYLEKLKEAKAAGKNADEL